MFIVSCLHLAKVSAAHDFLRYVWQVIAVKGMILVMRKRENHMNEGHTNVVDWFLY